MTTSKLLTFWISLAATTVFAESAKPTKTSDRPEGFHEMKIGDSAPDFDLIGIDEEHHTLANYAKADVLMVAFLSNHCPTSQAIEERVKKLQRDFKGRGFQIIAINPNDPAALRPDELGYSKYNDSFPEMKAHAKEQDFNFPYLYDGETQATAKAYGCLATPHVMIFDKERKLRYQGRFDDSRYVDEATVTAPDARNAVEALLAGNPVPVEETKPHGCSTKWISKRAAVTTDNENWEKGTVDVELIDEAGIAALRKNPTKKLRMINIWATWCGPCVEEFPELVKTARKFGLRDFEFITISLDDPKTITDVKAFLEKNNAVIPAKVKPTLAAEGRKTNSYVFSGKSTDPLIEILNPDWDGTIPHTVIIAPGGEIVLSHNGQIEGEKLRTFILDHMGRFYVPEAESATK